MPKYAAGYDYVMRIDDDAIIEEKLPDLFEWTHNKNLVYASNIIHIDCGLCCYGMKEFFLSKFPDKKETIDKMFIKQNVPSRAMQLTPFRSLLSITENTTEPIGDSIEINAPIIYYNNFFITKSSFWQREDVKQLIDDIDKNGSIFYVRWGDAPLHTIITMLLGGSDATSRAIFKYSKRMQREAFYGDDKEYHSYIPANYNETSCITERKPA